ncbi:MAG: KOW domain-containing RNA-binding protein [Oscillospiraceae bacterium]|nr:KOW domain-containing RNA-binding protein [Oscillospiraceae bacterium]
MDFVRGQIVRSKAGRDKGRFFVVLGTAGNMAQIADGGLRGLNRPKSKKLMHLSPTKTILSDNTLTSDKQLNMAIGSFVKTQLPLINQGGFELG